MADEDPIDPRASYYERNLLKCREQSRAYQLAHPEYYKQYQKEYYQRRKAEKIARGLLVPRTPKPPKAPKEPKAKPEPKQQIVYTILSADLPSLTVPQRPPDPRVFEVCFQ